MLVMALHNQPFTHVSKQIILYFRVIIVIKLMPRIQLVTQETKIYFRKLSHT